MFNIQDAYTRGWLLTDAHSSNFIGHEGIQHWSRTYFGKYKLWYDGKLGFGTTSSANLAVAVLGLVVNPFDEQTNNVSISEKLFELLEKGEDGFYRYLDQLSGSFIVIYRLGNDVRLLQDACATKVAYYVSSVMNEEKAISVSSHLTLLAHIHKLKSSELAQKIRSDIDYKKDPSPYLPGLVTPINNVFPLIANHFLSLRNVKQVRFFPRERLDNHTRNYQEAKEWLAHVFRKQAALLAQHRKVVIATTGGKDSRLTLAAFNKLPEDSYCFTFSNPHTGQFGSDLMIAKKLTQKKKFLHKSFDISEYKNGDFLKILKIRSPDPIWENAAFLYYKEFDKDAVHIRSTVSEVGRCFYNRQRGSNEISAHRLKNSYTVTDFAKSDFLNQIFDEYIKETEFSIEKIFNYDPLDIFYWEHRNSKWQNILCHEAEIAADVFIPYNNREILKVLLTVPAIQRQKAQMHLDLINYMAPEFLKIPIDSDA